MEAITAVRPSQRVEHAFFLGMTLLTTVIVLRGFAPSFFLRGIVAPGGHSYLDPPLQPIRWLFIAHGLIFSSWIALTLTQVTLVASGRTDLHRRLGRVAFGVAPLMVVIGTIVAGYAAVHGFHDVPMPSATFVTVPVCDLVLYAAFVTAGLAARPQPQTHKRWMLLAMIVIAEAGWGRIDALNPQSLPPWVSTELVLLLPLIAWDLTRLGRLNAATLWGGIAMACAYSLRLWVGASPAWLAIVKSALG